MQGRTGSGWGVLFVTSTLEVGGSETKVVRIANALAASGMRAAIAYLNPPETLLDRVAPGVPVTHLERRGKFSLRSLRRLREITASAPQLLVAVNLYPLLYVVPAAARAAQARSVCLINTTDFVDGQWIWGRVFAPFLRRCDLLVYGCRYQQDLWTRKYRLPAGRSRHIYNGVDTAHFAPDENGERARTFRARHGIPPDALLVGGVGRFAPEKHFELLIAAVRRLHDSQRPVDLVLVGDGAGRAKLEACVADAGLGRYVAFTGVLDDIRPALAAMDVFVLPSRAVETFSNAALEAMAMERPVVLSRIGGAAEMVVPGESGFLFEARDLDGLVRELETLCDSRELRERVGHAARRRVIESFSF